MTSNRGAGHLGPLLPFARAFLRAGHDVVLAAAGSTRATVEGAGVPFLALAEPPDDEIDAVLEAFPGLSNEEQGVRMMQEVFAGIDVRSSLPGVLGAIADHQPDVVLREPTEYAGLLAAERLGVPHGRIAIMAAAMESWAVPVVAPVLDGHRERLRLSADPLGRRITESRYLTAIPEALEDPEDLGPAHTMRFREVEPAPAPLPEWWGADDRPLVYATYGSVVSTLLSFPGLFRDTVAALETLPVRALFTIGTEVEREALGPVPANVRAEPWVPQAAVMPHAAAMIGHGGAGTTRIALAGGVPAVVVPAFADQNRNAERVAALGAGVALTGAEDVRDQLAAAVRLLLEEPSYRAVARRVAGEVAALPPVHEAPSALLESLTPARAA